jgi:hypothetical protein
MERWPRLAGKPESLRSCAVQSSVFKRNLEVCILRQGNIVESAAYTKDIRPNLQSSGGCFLQYFG